MTSSSGWAMAMAANGDVGGSISLPANLKEKEDEELVRRSRRKTLKSLNLEYSAEGM